MTVKINGTNTAASPAFTGADTDTGLQVGTNELNLVTGGTARFTVQSDGDVTVAAGDCNLTDGNLVVAAGHGIDFSANSNASGMTSELLDDYEEGTFTPSINAGFTASYNNQTGRYTKIGNTVHFFINIDLSSISGSSTYPYAAVEGLPFTALNTGVVDNGVTVAWQYALGSNVDHAYVSQNETRIVLLGANTNGTRVHWNPAQVWDDPDGRIALSGCYLTTA